MITPAKLHLRDKSGSITAGGTAQDIYNPAHATTPDEAKHVFTFENISDTAMWLRFGKTAVADKGFYIPAGGYFEPPAGVVFAGKCSVLCATTGKKFLCNIA